uniref:Uncharacterized protein n=1 Tax=viral metagenome TaxID=1070528 RepID=A0A6C0KKL4_9ZZZZ
MSTPAVPVMPPYNQFQNFYPAGVNPYALDPAQLLTSNLYDSTTRINDNIVGAQRAITGEIATVNKNIYDTIAQNGVAIERTAANGMATTERVNSQLATAVERNGGNIMTAIEKVAGEGRLTTTVVDAASRQAANDSARDILAAVERNGGATVGASKDAYNGLLASIERNSGENRMTTVTADTASQARLADVRRDITTNLNAMEGEVLSTVNKGNSELITAIGNTAWETRQNQNTQYAALLSETQKSASANALQSANQYASALLEAQKSTALLANKQDNHFAALLSKQDNHFAALLLEQQKSKECITLQLQEAKYEALKNKCDLSKEMGECCCEIKQKIDQRSQDVINTVDTLDRNRLRDEVNTINNENTILKLLDYGDYGYGRGRGRRSRSPGRRGH